MIDIESEIRKDIEDQLSKDIQEEIDFAIVADILKETGWVEIIIDPFDSNMQAIEMLDWLKEHVKDRHFGRGTRWLFKEPKDATIFSLKYS